MRLADREFVWHNSAPHSDPREFKARMAERQRQADRERRDREIAEERAADAAREMIDRSRA